MRLCPHSIGDVIQRTDGTDPNSLWPSTTWTAITDTFLLGSGSTYTLGATGGSETVTLTVQQIPAHAHSYQPSYWCGGSPGYNGQAICGTGSRNGYSTFNAIPGQSTANNGGGQAHDNMPPYVVVDIWQRVA